MTQTRGASGGARQDESPAATEAGGVRVKNRKDKTNPRRFAYLILLLFAIPPPWPLFALGAALVVAAVLLHGWAAGYLARAGYKERAKILTVRGPYRHTRNPYYAAHLAMDFGFFCVAGLPLLYLIYFPFIFSVYRRWVMNEERFLEREFGDAYRQFKREVPRWYLRLTPAPARGREQVFTWSMFMRNNELPRAAAHVLVLSAFGYYFFFGNPFAGVDPLVRATIAGGVVVWYLLRDVFPLDVSRLHIGWLAFAAAAAVGAALFLAVAPVWRQWGPPASWVAIAVGSALAAVVVVAVFSGRESASGKGLGDIFPQPISEWYTLGLGLGLLSLTLGGVWLGILIPFVLWALRLAGAAPMRPIPRSTSMGLMLLVTVVGFVTYAIGAFLW